MRIPTGSFGNAVPTPKPTNISLGNPGAVGQALSGLGKELEQQTNSIIRARAGDELLDYQIKIKDINESIRQGVESGALRADQIEKTYQDAVGQLDKPAFAGLDIAGQETATRGIKRYESAGLSTAMGYYHSALKIEARDQVDSQLDQLGKLTNYPDADVEKINAMSAGLEEQGRLAYGGQWSKVRQGWVDKNWFNQAQQKLMQARNDGTALADLNNQLTAENGFYVDKLDPDKRNALLNQAMGYQSRLEAKAAAAEAKREALAARTYNSFAQQVYSDLPTTAEQQEQLIASTKGTSVEGDVKDLLSDQETIRKVVSAGPVESQNYVNNLYANLNANGGDMRQWRLAQRLNSAVQKTNQQLMQTPLLFNQNRTGDAVAPLDMTALNPTAAAVTGAMDGMDISQRFGVAIADRSATIDAVRSNTGVNVPRLLLLPQEATAIADELKKQPPENQIATLSRLRDMVGNDSDYRAIMKQISPDSPGTAYSALVLSAPDVKATTGGAATPYSQIASYVPKIDKYETAKTILIGEQMLNPTKAMKDAGIQPVTLPSDEKLKRAFDQSTGNAFAYNPQARQIAYGLFKSAYAGVAYNSGNSDMTRTESTNQDVVDKAIQMATGGVYKGLNGGDVAMPFGMDKDTFKDRYTDAAQTAFKNAGLNPYAQSSFKPVNLGGNQYGLVNGSGRWAVDPRNNQKIVVRVE
ncbi:hypothetical protein [Dickeya sp. ws52]|uniref:hypothetical protein n=1 Tax=Dickeya sp. ws52 TaxID=2576377 RepID=UPI00117D52AF|nr:hypothetical protein [Dickeya sp. ws52]TYL43908.1 hypothetical protein FDP13_03640 [Dickeya sp. ws52]